MKRVMGIVVGSAALLVGCGQSSDTNAANEAAANSAQAARKKPAYCFFKDEEMKGWSASRGKDGNVTVRGKAHVKDPRYKPVFGEPGGGPNGTVLSPTISQNDTGYATADNWWDLTTTLPNSASVTAVQVECGGKTVADLKVPAKS